LSSVLSSELGQEIKYAVLMDKKRQIMIINSLGEHVEDIQTRTVFYTEVVSYKDGILQRGYESMGGNVGFELFERNPLRK